MKIFLIIIVLSSAFSCASKKRQSRLCELFERVEINQDSIKSNISVACNTWAQSPWSKDYEEDAFISYILPPKIADEPLEYYWRTDIPKWLKYDDLSDDIQQAALTINAKIEVDTRPEDWGNRQMGYTATMSGKFGKCDDRAILTTMAMRSSGIPAAFELIPMWGSGNNGHSFCSVISPDESILVFQDSKDNGINTHFRHKVPKVYRRLFFEDTTSLAYQRRHSEEIPTLFADFRLKDVTDRHNVGHRDVFMKSMFQSNNRLCYLAVFHPNGWFPITQGRIENENMIFKNVGTGTDVNGNQTLEGENIGNGILYLPVIYNNGCIPSSYPLIVASDEIKILHPSVEKESITLYRKYPKLERISAFADNMIGGIIEGANKADFSDAAQIHYIHERPLSRFQKIVVKDRQSFRYIRYRKPQGFFSLAEFEAFNAASHEIPGTPICCKSIKDIPDTEKIYDNAPLTFFEISHGMNIWVGIDFGQSVEISAIGFCPRNDDNEISPGDTYELFYWNGAWKSLGEKQATTYSLTYHNVPKNALLWLRNNSKGKEERPFTYENNKQIWW